MRFTVSLAAVAAVVALVGIVDFGQGPDPARAEADEEPERIELGTVDWHRDFDRAKEVAEETGKPMFVLFTEVPGCSTVRGYGRRVLSNDLVVDAIEAEFVPVAVFNNVEGEDREILESFGEPTWNNPAVRIIRPDRTELAPRLYGDYTVEKTAATMATALRQASGTSVPPYLELLVREQAAEGRSKTAIFGMYCFWSGEAKLGALEGVVQTRPGFLEGTEVVEVTYDPEVTSLETLAERAVEIDAASSFYARTDREASAARAAFGDAVRRTDDSFRYAADDDNHRIQGTRYESVEMTELQKTRVNSAIFTDGDPKQYLSPRQRRELP